MRVLEHFKIIPFPLPLIETQCFWGFFCVFFFFLDIHCENLVELLEVKLIKVWGNSLWLGPPGTPHCFSELSTLSLWHLVNYNSGSPTPLLLSWRFLLVGFCSTKLWFSVFTCLSLYPILGANVCPVTSFLYGSCRIDDFSVCSVFYLFYVRVVDIWALYMLDQKLEAHKYLPACDEINTKKKRKCFRNLNSSLKLLWYPSTQFYILQKYWSAED